MSTVAALYPHFSICSSYYCSIYLHRKYGMNLRTVLWSRLTLALLSLIFLLLYTAQYKKYRSNYAYLADKCSKLVVHSGGLSAQLQLLMDRNHRAEKLLADLHARYNQIMKENDEKRRNDEVELSICKAALKKCLVGVKTDEKQFNNGKDTNLQSHFFQCQMEMKEFKKQIQQLKEEAKNISIIRSECQKLLVNSRVSFVKNFF
ncbi:DNA repair protein [Dirofilaria immitis]